MYLKVAKDMDMNKIIEKLESVANAKSNWTGYTETQPGRGTPSSNDPVATSSYIF